MSRRRKIDDDDDDGASQHKRRRNSEPVKVEDRLESLICRVGEKSTSSLESNLEGLAGVLEADLPNYKSKILRILTAVYARPTPTNSTQFQSRMAESSSFSPVYPGVHSLSTSLAAFTGSH